VTGSWFLSDRRLLIPSFKHVNITNLSDLVAAISQRSINNEALASTYGQQ